MSGSLPSLLSHAETWQPASADERLDRLEAIAEIRQLVERYGLAVDTRNIDMLVNLFVPDVQVGPDAFGRDALRTQFTGVLRAYGPTVHFVGNHVIEFADANTATGIVFCTDQLGSRTDDIWEQGFLHYWDEYSRVDGHWYFRRRKLHRLYKTDVLSRPRAGAGLDGSTMKTRELLDAYPSWNEFWAQDASSPDA